MSFEEQIRSSLSRRADVIDPPPFTAELTRRVRLRRIALLSLSIAIVVTVVVAAPFALRTVTEGTRAFDVSQGGESPIPGGPEGRVLAFDSGEFRAARVLVLDPADGEVLRAFEVPGALSMATSPDGKAAYFVTVTGPDGSFEASLVKLDTISGKAVTLGRLDHPFSSVSAGHLSPLITSDDGRYVHILRVDSTGRNYSTMTFDTVTNSFPRGPVELGPCGPVAFLAAESAPGGVYLVCSDTNDIKFINNDSQGSGAEAFALPEVHEVRGTDNYGNTDDYGRLAGADVSPEGLIYAIRLNGQVVAVDTQRRKVIQELDGNLSSREFVAAGIKVLDDKLYLAVGEIEGNSLAYANRIVVLDVDSGTSLMEASLERPISMFEVGPGPGRIAAVNPDMGVVQLIDTFNLHEVATARFPDRYIAGIEVPELGQE